MSQRVASQKSRIMSQHQQPIDFTMSHHVATHNLYTTYIKAGTLDAPPIDKLHALAARVERLCPSHRNPERFHEDKSEIVAELQRLASEVKHG